MVDPIVGEEALLGRPLANPTDCRLGDPCRREVGRPTGTKAAERERLPVGHACWGKD